MAAAVNSGDPSLPSLFLAFCSSQFSASFSFSLLIRLVLLYHCSSSSSFSYFFSYCWLLLLLFFVCCVISLGTWEGGSQSTRPIENTRSLSCLVFSWHFFLFFFSSPFYLVSFLSLSLSRFLTCTQHSLTHIHITRLLTAPFGRTAEHIATRFNGHEHPFYSSSSFFSSDKFLFLFFFSSQGK